MIPDPVSVLVDGFITRWLPEHRAHLTDTDDNDGEFLRRGLRGLVDDARGDVGAVTFTPSERARLAGELAEWRARALEAEGTLVGERVARGRVFTALRDTLRAAT